jgi:predicted phosphodiesterase
MSSWNDEIETALKELMIETDSWKQITEEINKKFNINISVASAKSYAYRRGLTLPKKEKEYESRKETIDKKYGVVSDDDIALYVINTTKEWVPIWTVGDMHAGSEAFDEDSFMIDRDWAIKNNMYLMGVGDWMEASVPTHMPKTMFGQNATPYNQAKYLIETMLPFKGRTITIVDGNHEKRVRNLTSFRPLEEVSTELDALHMNNGGLVTIRVNDIDYNIYITHGASFAKGNKEVEDFGAIWKNVDVVIEGHTHRCESWKMNQGWINVNQKKVLVEQIGIRSGHYLLQKGYVEEKPYKPLLSESMVIWLNSKTKEIQVSRARSSFSLV